MGQKYAVVNLGTGAINGGFLDASINTGALPGNAVAITYNQWLSWVQNPPGFKWNGTTVVSVTPPPAPVTGASTALAGCTVHSTSTAGMNGTYPCDPTTLAVLQGNAAYVTAKSAFPGSLSFLSLAQTNGTIYPFASTTLFLNFVNALVNFSAQCAQFDLLAGAGISLPGTQTIS